MRSPVGLPSEPPRRVLSLPVAARLSRMHRGSVRLRMRGEGRGRRPLTRCGARHASKLPAVAAATTGRRRPRRWPIGRFLCVGARGGRAFVQGPSVPCVAQGVLSAGLTVPVIEALPVAVLIRMRPAPPPPAPTPLPASGLTPLLPLMLAAALPLPPMPSNPGAGCALAVASEPPPEMADPRTGRPRRRSPPACRSWSRREPRARWRPRCPRPRHWRIRRPHLRRR